MKITVNDIEYAVEAQVSLKAFLTERGLPTEGVAIACGGRIIPRKDWDSVALEEGMALTMIQAVSGG